MVYDQGWGRLGRSQRGVGRRHRHRARVVVESLERRELLTGAITNLMVVPASVVENQPATGVTVATFNPSPSSIPATSFSAVINWSDGQISSGNVVADGSVSGQYDVIPVNPPPVGNAPTEPITVTVTLTNSGTIWMPQPAFPTGLSGINTSVAVSGPAAYVLGGNASGFDTAAVEMYAGSFWATAASMPDARRQVAAATDNSGLIYAIGGLTASAGPTIEVDVFNPMSNTWTVGAPLPAPVSGAAAVTGPDGRIYAIGGSDFNNNPTAVVDAYNPSSGTWTAVASLPSARTRLAAAVGANGEIYAIGGTIASGFTSSEVDAYNVATNSWSVVASLPTARSALGAVEGVDDQIYAIGGSTGPVSSSEVDAYNPLSNTWTTVSSLPLDRQGLGAAALPNGLILAISGFNSESNTYETEVDSLDVAYYSATASGSLTVTAGGPSLTVTAPIMVAAGQTPTNILVGVATGLPLEVTEDGFYAEVSWGDGSTSYNGLQYFADPNTAYVYATKPSPYLAGGQYSITVRVAAGRSVNVWDIGQPAPALPTPREGLAVATSSTGLVYAAGGSDMTNTPSAEVDVYDPTSFNAWSTVAPLPLARTKLSLAPLPGGYMLAIGGQDLSGQADSEVDLYNPTTNTWSTAPPLPGPRFFAATAVGPDGTVYVIGGRVATRRGDGRGRRLQPEHEHLVGPGVAPHGAGRPGSERGPRRQDLRFRRHRLHEHGPERHVGLQPGVEHLDGVHPDARRPVSALGRPGRRRPDPRRGRVHADHGFALGGGYVQHGDRRLDDGQSAADPADARRRGGDTGRKAARGRRPEPVALRRHDSRASGRLHGDRPPVVRHGFLDRDRDQRRDESDCGVAHGALGPNGVGRHGRHVHAEHRGRHAGHLFRLPHVGRRHDWPGERVRRPERFGPVRRCRR